MSSRVNAARQSANYGEPRVSELVGELLGRFRSVMGGASRPDNADRVMIAVEKFAPDVEHNRRRMDLPEGLRIRRRLLRDDGHTGIADPWKLGGKVNRRFPI